MLLLSPRLSLPQRSLRLLRFSMQGVRRDSPPPDSGAADRNSMPHSPVFGRRGRRRADDTQSDSCACTPSHYWPGGK